MYITKLKDEKQINDWLKGMNNAFKKRSSKNIPYEEKKIDLNTADINILGLYNDVDILVGGASISYEMENNTKICKIHDVWIDTNLQSKGLGLVLMKKIEEEALKEQACILLLNVSNIYIPAVSLYKKAGFKNYMIYANVPKTYYFIRMIKPIGGYRFSNFKRINKLILSKIKFKILFSKDSTPRFNLNFLLNN